MSRSTVVVGVLAAAALFVGLWNAVALRTLSARLDALSTVPASTEVSAVRAGGGRGGFGAGFVMPDDEALRGAAESAGIPLQDDDLDDPEVRQRLMDVIREEGERQGAERRAQMRDAMLDEAEAFAAEEGLDAATSEALMAEIERRFDAFVAVRQDVRDGAITWFEARREMAEKARSRRSRCATCWVTSATKCSTSACGATSAAGGGRRVAGCEHTGGRMAYEAELSAAIDAVQKASRLCRAVQQRLVAGSTLQKGDRSPVTVADFGAQAVVSRLLALEFPHDALVGEEDASALRGNDAMRAQVVDGVLSVLPDLHQDEILDAIDRGVHPGGPGRHWTLDPIDGTKGFLRLEQYAVALGLIVDGEVELGVLGCPNLPVDAAAPDGPRGCLFWAVRGGGARWRPLDGGDVHPLFVDEVGDPSEARFCESVESGHSNQDHAAQVAAKLGIHKPPYRIDSQCKYAAVARGDASIYLRLPTRADYVEKIWDHAAGFRIVTEAGGTVTDVAGQPLDFGLGRQLSRNRGVIVTNGRFHDQVLGAVQSVLG